MKKYYTFINHTADIGIEVKNNNLIQVFIHTAKGMFDIITDIDKISLEKEVRIEINGNSYEDLLIDWLNELLFYYETEKLVFGEFLIDELGPNIIKSIVLGENLKQKKHKIKKHIKAATYHNLKIVKENNSWKVVVIFDV